LNGRRELENQTKLNHQVLIEIKVMIAGLLAALCIRQTRQQEFITSTLETISTNN